MVPSSYDVNFKFASLAFAKFRVNTVASREAILSDLEIKSDFRIIAISVRLSEGRNLYRSADPRILNSGLRILESRFSPRHRSNLIFGEATT